MRRKLTDIVADGNNFEKYLAQCLRYAMPRQLLEQFADYHRTFSEDIKRRQFDNIVSEIWMGHFPTGIYAGLAKAMGKKLVFPQHGAFTHLYNSNVEWLQYTAADVYLSHGWRDANVDNIAQGGFSCRKVDPWQYDETKRDILFICNAWPLYLVRFAEHAVGNDISIRKLANAALFIESLPQGLADSLLVRDRVIDHHWDMQTVMRSRNRVVRLDPPDRPCLDSIAAARIVVIDQMSTVFAEVLAAGVPFIILQDEQADTLRDEYAAQFKELTAAQVVHYSVDSAVEHVTEIYDDVLGWWNSKRVQNAVNSFKDEHLADPEKTEEYLLSL